MVTVPTLLLSLVVTLSPPRPTSPAPRRIPLAPWARGRRSSRASTPTTVVQGADPNDGSRSSRAEPPPIPGFDPEASAVRQRGCRVARSSVPPSSPMSDFNARTTVGERRISVDGARARRPPRASATSSRLRLGSLAGGRPPRRSSPPTAMSRGLPDSGRLTVTVDGADHTYDVVGVGHGQGLYGARGLVVAAAAGRTRRRAAARGSSCGADPVTWADVRRLNEYGLRVTSAAGAARPAVGRRAARRDPRRASGEREPDATSWWRWARRCCSSSRPCSSGRPSRSAPPASDARSPSPPATAPAPPCCAAPCWPRPWCSARHPAAAGHGARRGRGHAPSSPWTTAATGLRHRRAPRHPVGPARRHRPVRRRRAPWSRPSLRPAGSGGSTSSASCAARASRPARAWSCCGGRGAHAARCRSPCSGPPARPACRASRHCSACRPAGVRRHDRRGRAHPRRALPRAGLLAGVGRLGGRLPTTLRMAARDLARHRSRSAPSVAAVLAAVAGLTFGLTGLASDTEQSAARVPAARRCRARPSSASGDRRRSRRRGPGRRTGARRLENLLRHR